MLHAYKEHFRLTEQELASEPWEAIERHFVIADYRRKRDNLEVERQQSQQQN